MKDQLDSHPGAAGTGVAFCLRVVSGQAKSEETYDALKLPFKQVVRAAVRVQMQALRCRSVLIHCISSLAGAGGADERQPCQNAYQVALLEQEFCHRWRFVAVTATPAVSLSPAFIHRVYGCNSVVPPVLLLLQACSALWNAVWRATLGSTR